MTKPTNIASIEKATKRSWGEWLTFLANDHETPHADIAKKVEKNLGTSVKNPGWWAQGIAVAYEQTIERRAPGQQSDGTFEISVSKILTQSRRTLFAHIVELFKATHTFNNQLPTNVRTSETPVRSYWRCTLSDSSNLTVSVEEKAPNKSLLVVTHAGLPGAEVAAQQKDYWQDFLQQNI